MDYILNKIDFKLQMFKNKNEKLSLINLYRSKFIYIITLYLAISYSRNPDCFNKNKLEILKILRHPSEGALLDIIRRLKQDLLSTSDSKDKRGISNILQDYVSIRNRDFGHDYSCDPKDHSNLIARFENLAKEISAHRYPYISNDLYLIIINMINGNTYEGSCYNPNGGTSFWQQTTNENLKQNELYVTSDPNNPQNFIRVSPFLCFDSITDDIYLFRQIDNEKNGLVSYIKLFQQNPNGYKRTWEEFALHENRENAPKVADLMAQEAMKERSFSKEEKDNLIKTINKMQEAKSNLLVVGDCCTGKGTLINTLFNTDIAEVGIEPNFQTQITEYKIENLSVWEANIYQTEGLEKLFAESTIDAVLYVSSLSSGSLREKEIDFISNFLSPKLGGLDRIIIAMSHQDTFPRGFAETIIDGVIKQTLELFGQKTDVIPFSGNRAFSNNDESNGLFKIINALLLKIPEEKRIAYEGVFNKGSATDKTEIDKIQKQILDSINKIYIQDLITQDKLDKYITNDYLSEIHLSHKESNSKLEKQIKKATETDSNTKKFIDEFVKAFLKKYNL